MLTLAGVSKKRGAAFVLKNIDLGLEPGKTLAILGPSGCGKTTLLQMMAGLETATSGTLVNDAEKTAYVFQEDRLVPWATVYGNLALVRKKNDAQKIAGLLAAVGLDGVKTQLPAALSGGMKQRCALARALYFEAPLLLLDEPFRSQDLGMRKNLVQQLKDIQQAEKTAIALVTHDLEDALELADDIVVLSGKPAQVIGRLSIGIEKEERDLSSPRMQGFRWQLEGMLVL
ncbi:MAG: ABC transporter ATP-binding protein [Turicibacter sp.]|nr:ABC transporter ATP-binding protein [Turicibacter sp.]